MSVLRPGAGTLFISNRRETVEIMFVRLIRGGWISIRRFLHNVVHLKHGDVDGDDDETGDDAESDEDRGFELGER